MFTLFEYKIDHKLSFYVKSFIEKYEISKKTTQKVNNIENLRQIFNGISWEKQIHSGEEVFKEILELKICMLNTHTEIRPPVMIYNLIQNLILKGFKDLKSVENWMKTIFFKIYHKFSSKRKFSIHFL